MSRERSSRLFFNVTRNLLAPEISSAGQQQLFLAQHRYFNTTFPCASQPESNWTTTPAKSIDLRMANSTLDIPRKPEELNKLKVKDVDYEKAVPLFARLGEDLTLEDMVATRDISQRAVIPPDPDVAETEIHIPARDGHLLRTKVFRPANATANTAAALPAIVLYHGGGFTVGSPEHCTDPARSLVKQLPAVVIAPSYRLAPEHPFPQGVDDAWDSFQWIAQHLSDPSIGASASKGFVLGGISAGGNMSSVLMHLARDTKLTPSITGVWIACGSCCPPDAVSDKDRSRYLSRTDPECRDMPLTKNMHEIFMNALKAPMDNPMYMSMLWPTGHANLPPVVIQVCGRDYSRDEGLIYADVLQDAGIDVKVNIYSGLPHCFWYIYPQLPATKRWREETVSGFKWLLGL